MKRQQDDVSEVTEERQAKARESFWNWRGWHVIFLVAPVVCLLLFFSEGLRFYYYGRSGHHPAINELAFYPAVGVFLWFCVSASFLRLLVGWAKCTRKTRLLITAEISVPVVVAALCSAHILAPVESNLTPPGVTFLRGFADRVRSQADIPAIRDWLKTLDKEDYIPRRDYYSYDTLPDSLKRAGLGVISLSADKSGSPMVNFSAGGGFDHWGATIGLEDMVIHESYLKSHYDAWLLVEPGVYVYAW